MSLKLLTTRLKQIKLNMNQTTGEDLRYKPSVVEQTKFDYFPLGKIFNKRLTEEDKNEGILDSVKNIGEKNEELLKAIKDQRIKQSDSKKN